VVTIDNRYRMNTLRSALGRAPTSLGLLVVPLAAAGTAIAASTLQAPSKAAIGDPLVVRVSGGLTPRLTYRATFTESADQRRPGRKCARNIDRPYRAGTSVSRIYRFRGRVPRTLACVQGARRFLTPVKRGRYVIVVGHKTGKARWDPDAITLRKNIRITG
jgi:hypothetical protein